MNAAEQEVLRICRSGKTASGKSQDGIWCMRELSPRHEKFPQGKCVVIDNARWSAPVIAQGADWETVLAQLRAQP